MSSQTAGIIRPSIALSLAFAQVTYYRLFGKAIDLSDLTIPEAPDDREYIGVPILKELIEWTGGFPKEGLHEARKKLFPCYKYATEALDVAIPAEKDERTIQNGSYIVLMLDSERPDEDLLGKSANDVAEMHILTSTDPEYAIFSAVYFLKHGYHPDRQTWTINTGSRYRDGSVPYGDWDGDLSRVGWCLVAGRDPNLGARRVCI